MDAALAVGRAGLIALLLEAGLDSPNLRSTDSIRNAKSTRLATELNPPKSASFPSVIPKALVDSEDILTRLKVEGYEFPIPTKTQIWSWSILAGLLTARLPSP